MPSRRGPSRRRRAPLPLLLLAFPVLGLGPLALPSPALAVDLGHCQKSGCRQSSPDDAGAKKALASSSARIENFAVANADRPSGTFTSRRLTYLLAEWIVVFALLRLISGARDGVRGCEGAVKAIVGACATLVAAAERVWNGARTTCARWRGGRGRRAASSGAARRRSLDSSRRSESSLGSLVDLIGWDEETGTLGDDGKSYKSGGEEDASCASSSTYSASAASSAYTPYCSESESDATSAGMKGPRGKNGASRDVVRRDRDDASSLISLSSLLSTSTGAVASDVSANSASIDARKKPYSRASNLETHYEHEGSSCGTKSSYTGTGGSSALSSFISYFRGQKRKESPQRARKDGEDASRHSSADDSRLRGSGDYDRPLYHNGRRRRGTVDNGEVSKKFSHYNRDDYFSQASSTGRSRGRHGTEGMQQRYAPVSTGGRGARGPSPPARRRPRELALTQGVACGVAARSEVARSAAARAKDREQERRDSLEVLLGMDGRASKASPKEARSMASTCDSLTEVNLRSVG